MIQLKIIVIFLTLFAYPVFVVAQHWQSIGGIDRVPRCMYEDTTENVLYIGGEFFVAGTDTVAGIVKWDGNRFYSLGCGLNWGCDTSCNYYNYGVIVYAITKYNNEIYVSGDFRKAGNIPVNYIARWNGTTWDSVGHGLQWPALVLTVIDNELYVGGAFDSAGGIQAHSLAKWNGSQWSTVHDIPSFWSDSSTNYINAVAKYNGELYVGGNFDNDSIHDIVKFNGTNWQSVGGGMHGNMSGLVNMVIYNEELYIAGAFYKVDGNVGNFIQSWDGTQWNDVGGGTTYELFNPYSNGQIHDMKVHNDELYIAGVFKYAGGVHAQNVAKWNGTEWCGLGGNFDNVGVCLGFCRDTLYIGGGFWTIDGDSINFLAKWIGGSYVDTCSNTSSVDEIEFESNMIISPNPASGYIEIRLKSTIAEFEKIFIYDALGSLIACKEIINKEQIIKINTSALPQGFYLLHITDNTGIVYSGKFIKL